MTRIKIDFPAKVLFETELDIRISDVNYGGHLGNNSVLSLVHESRIRFLNHLGYSEKDIEGKGIIMTDAAVMYKSEGFYGDRLKIQVAVADLSHTGFDMLYRLIRTSDQKEIAIVKTGIAFFDYDTKRITGVSPLFSDKINNLL